MSDWYSKIVNDLDKIPEMITSYESELVDAQKQLKIKGLIQQRAAELPAIVELRFRQLQEIEAILEYVNLLKSNKRSHRFKHFLEGYNRALSSRDAEKYVEGDSEYFELCLLVNRVALLRNKFLAIHKGLEQKSFNLGHITRLRCAGLDDAML